MLNASIRSFNLPQFGTDTVIGQGRVVPSLLNMVKVIVRIVVEGNGSERYINGSNVTDFFLQMGQTKVERY